MADLTLPIIGLTTIAGYFFSRKPRSQAAAPSIDTFELNKPNGDNIYSSNKVEEVNREVLARSMANYDAAKKPAETGMIPPYFNAFVGSVGQNVKTSFEHQGNIQQEAKASEINRIANPMAVSTPRPIDARPMFQTDTLFQGTQRNDDGTDKSLLTGLPLDTSHNNMVPFFGSNLKQNVETFSNESVLDRHTGRQATYQPKKEVNKMFDNVQQDIHGTPIFTNQVDTDRYIPSLYRQNEKPFKPEYIAAPISGTFENPVAPQFRNVDELRASSKPKLSFEGRTVAGQMGSVRGVQAEFEKRRPDTFYEKGEDHMFKGPGGVVARKVDENFATNFKATSRNDQNVEYYGNANPEFKTTRQRAQLDNQNGFDALVQEPKRFNYENDYIRNVAGQQRAADYGKSAVALPETERASTSVSVVLNPQALQQGNVQRPSDLPKTTGKETLVSANHSGNVKTSFEQGRAKAYELGITDIHAKMTQKQNTLVEDYTGNLHRDDGMGYTVSKYNAKTTGRQTTHTDDYLPNGASHVKQTTVYNAYKNAKIRDTKEILVSGERPSGPQKFQTASGKTSVGRTTKIRDNMLLKEQTNKRPTTKTINQVPMGKVVIGEQRNSRDKLSVVQNNRLEPQLINAQHAQNPYSIFGKKK